MIVVHFESGLGNQMLDFVDYLVFKKMYPDEKIYMENIVYDIEECNKVICQWNGYELEKVFGIDIPNIKELFDHEEWKQILREIRETKFWEEEWNYGPRIVEVLNRHGMQLHNIAGDMMPHENNSKMMSRVTKKFNSLAEKSFFFQTVKRLLYKVLKNKFIKKYCGDKLYIKKYDNIYGGHYLNYMHKNSEVDFIDEDVEKVFCFENFKENDYKNIEMLEYIKNHNVVAIHARRGDMLSTNGFCYRFGYFKRAIKYIKKREKEPIFVFFCDPASVEWCKKNYSLFSLDENKDIIKFVDWNDGKDSYKDMQLMSHCNHNVITTSSFGWWGAWLNRNPRKITCTPYLWINSTNYF